MSNDETFKAFFDAFNEAASVFYGRDGRPPVSLGFGPVRDGSLAFVPMPMDASEVRLLAVFGRAFADSLCADYFAVAMDMWRASYVEGEDTSVPPRERPDRREGVAVFAYRRQAVPLASTAYWEVKRGPGGERFLEQVETDGPGFTGGRVLEWSSRVLSPEPPDEARVAKARAYLPVIKALVLLKAVSP